MIRAKYTRFMYKKKLKTADMNKVVTMGILLEYTDEFLIPRFADIIEESIRKSNGELKHELKTYIDEKFEHYTADIIKRLDRRCQPIG